MLIGTISEWNFQDPLGPKLCLGLYGLCQKQSKKLNILSDAEFHLAACPGDLSDISPFKNSWRIVGGCMRIVEHHCLYSTSNNADIQSSELQSQESLAPKVGKTLLLPFLPACSRTTCGHLQSDRQLN